MKHNHLPLLLNKSRVYLQDNKFQSNRGWFGGAKAAYNSTVVVLGQNLFQRNEAEAGGGVFASGSELVFRGYQLPFWATMHETVVAVLLLLVV